MKKFFQGYFPALFIMMDYDIAFFPDKEGTPGVILELKAAKSEDEMEDSRLLCGR